MSVQRFGFELGRDYFLSTESTVYGLALGFAFLPWEHRVTGVSVNTHSCLFDSIKRKQTFGLVDVCGYIPVLCLYLHTYAQTDAMFSSLLVSQEHLRERQEKG